jgi:hypothetical protein
MADAKEDVEEEAEGADGAVEGKRVLWEMDEPGAEGILFGQSGCGVASEGEVVADDLGEGGGVGATSAVGDLKGLETVGEVAGVAGAKGAGKGEFRDLLGDDRRVGSSGAKLEGPVVDGLFDGFATVTGGGIGKEVPDGREEVFAGDLAKQEHAVPEAGEGIGGAGERVADRGGRRAIEVAFAGRGVEGGAVVGVLEMLAGLHRGDEERELRVGTNVTWAQGGQVGDHKVPEKALEVGVGLGTNEFGGVSPEGGRGEVAARVERVGAEGERELNPDE